MLTWIAVFFTAIALLLGLAVYIISQRNSGQTSSQIGKKIAPVIGVLALLVCLYFVPWGKIFSSGGSSGREQSYHSQTKVPAEVALPIICGCESNNGNLGGKHFDNNGNVVRNVNDPDDPTNVDVGACQINLKYQAEIIKETGLDPEIEAENMEIATLIYQRLGDKPWKATRSCWAPKLGALTSRKEFEITVTAPPKSEDWGEEVEIPKGFSFEAWSKEGHLAKNDKGEVLTYDPSKADYFSGQEDRNRHFRGATERLSFRSKTEKPVEVSVKYFPARYLP